MMVYLRVINPKSKSKNKIIGNRKKGDGFQQMKGGLRD